MRIKRESHHARERLPTPGGALWLRTDMVHVAWYDLELVRGVDKCYVMNMIDYTWQTTTKKPMWMHIKYCKLWVSLSLCLHPPVINSHIHCIAWCCLKKAREHLNWTLNIRLLENLQFDTRNLFVMNWMPLLMETQRMKIQWQWEIHSQSTVESG